MTPVETCLYCNGDGYLWDGGPCEYCGGMGYIEDDDDEYPYADDDFEANPREFSGFDDESMP
jgi:hypothetical protein